MTINRILIVGAIVAIALSLPFFGPSWNKLMHLLGSILFMGNIMVSAVWMSLARRSRAPEAVRLGVRGVVLTDAVFTFPGSLLLLLNGGILATPYFKLHATWVFVSLGLFAVTGVLWGAVLVPVQRRLSAAMGKMPAGGPLPAGVEGLIATWFRVGGITLLLPLIVLVLMVLKPSF